MGLYFGVSCGKKISKDIEMKGGVMDPGEIQKEVEGMSEYQAKLVLVLMAAFNMPYEGAKEKANEIYDRVVKRGGKEDESG